MMAWHQNSDRIGRLRRVATVLSTRALPLTVVVVAVPALHSSATAVVVVLYSAWSASEAWLEHPGANREAKASRDDRGTRSIVLGVHLLCIALPLLERTIVPVSPSLAWIGAGGLMFSAGAALRIAAVTVLGPYFTAHVQTKADQTICRYGPYRFMRHPSYVGLFLINVGVSLVLAAPLSAIAAAIATYASIARRVAVEEETLITAFGPSYRAYQRIVPRYLPAPKWLRLVPPSRQRG